MKLGNILNSDRVNALQNSPNAYAYCDHQKSAMSHTNQAQKVVFPEPYDNASHYYNKSQFSKPAPPEPPVEHRPQNNMAFDIKSLLPMLMSGKMDMLKPLLSMFGAGATGGGMDFAKVFELFKPKPKLKKEEKSESKEEDISSKFDDMIIIED